MTAADVMALSEEPVESLYVVSRTLDAAFALLGARPDVRTSAESEEVCVDCGNTPATSVCFYCKAD